jgi:hypothetical protein
MKRPTSRHSPATRGEQAALFPRPSSATVTVQHLAPARITAVFDTFWRFAHERQEIFFRRLLGAPPPWTSDPTLLLHKFTNAYRASDRVSQFLIKRVIYRSDLPTTPNEVVFRIILFKLFNKIETWELLERQLGSITASEFHYDRFDRVLTDAMLRGERIYSAAYIMPSGASTFGDSKKHRNHLHLLQRMIRDSLGARLADLPRMHAGFDLLRSYPTIGDFLAYQYITDINYSDVTSFTEMEFVVPGPGAKDGIRKCFSDSGGLSEAELIRLMADRQELEFERLGLPFRSLFGRLLQLIDCQNLFCEVDKYARVEHPDVTGLSGRRRIKQRFVATMTPVEYWYPPKWGINHLVPKV